MQIIVRYAEGGLSLEVVGQLMDDFLKTAVWKMRLPKVARLAECVEDQVIYLQAGLPKRDFEGVLSALAVVEKRGYELVIDPSVEAARDTAGTVMDELAARGLAVKSHADCIQEAFSEYSQKLDALMDRPLRDRQKWDSFFLYMMGKAANFGVPGSGKTASSLGTFAYLRSLGLADRVLVVCPKNAFGSWRDEWESCFGSQVPCRSLCFHDAEFAGMPAAAKRKELAWNAGRYNLILVNYEAAAIYAEELADIASQGTLLVFDEVHKVKRVGGVRADAALRIARDAQYAVALTGTPIPNSYLDLYNLLHILYPDDYASHFAFSEAFLADPPVGGATEVNELLRPFFCRTNKRSLGVPDPCDDIVVEVEATRAESDMLDALQAAYSGDPLALIVRILQLESDPAMLSDALDPEELAGAVDGDGGVTGPGVEPAFIPPLSLCEGPTAKTKRCIELVEGLVAEGKATIVWCFFKRSMSNVKAALRARGISAEVINGGTSQEERDATLRSFKAGITKVLITNPHTLAESVSLHSVCHDAVYFEYSYNLVHLLQSKDRIHRLGLPDGQYTQYHFLQTVFPLTDEGRWSLDAKIYLRLQEKEEAMLAAIDQGVLEGGATDDDDVRAVLGGLRG